MTYQDSHGGFHGDGLLLVELAFARRTPRRWRDGILRRGDLWNEGRLTIIWAASCTKAARRGRAAGPGGTTTATGTSGTVSRMNAP